MGEKGWVRKVPTTTRVVGHNIDRSWNVMVTGDVAVGTLMQRVVPEELSASCDQGSIAFGRPGHGGTIVARQPHGALRDIASVDKDIFLSNHPGQFNVGDEHRTGRIIGGNQRRRNVRRERLAPHDGWCAGIKGVKPYPTHTVLTGVARANVRWIHGDKFM